MTKITLLDLLLWDKKHELELGDCLSLGRQRVQDNNANPYIVYVLFIDTYPKHRFYHFFFYNNGVNLPGVDQEGTVDDLMNILFDEESRSRFLKKYDLEEKNF